MPAVLRFGIASLDELLGAPPQNSGGAAPFGMYLPKTKQVEAFTTSVCLIGPNGTGKSIFGLHMASTYLADCQVAHKNEPHEAVPAVLYVSTDLTYNMAQRAWRNFALGYPFSRKDPFDLNPDTMAPEKDWEPVELKECNPTSLAQDFSLIETDRGKVIFVDMASFTAGDDWGFLHKLLSLLPECCSAKDPSALASHDLHPRHLVVMDAIEGFEALAGELNAFGEKSTRRSRIAQVMRLIAGKCHAVLVVEESNNYEKLAEEFVADTVIRLDNLSTRNYERRVLKVEKVRGQSHIRGWHHYSIRSGNGSTTGNQINPDDPEVPSPLPASSDSDEDENPKHQSYVQVFHSVHRLNRKVMEEKGKARPKLEPSTYYAAFGIKYLDNMLGGKAEVTTRKSGGTPYRRYYHDTRGLPCRSTTALIGDSLTQKSNLGKAFLSRCFYSLEERLRPLHRIMSKSKKERDSAEVAEIWRFVRRRAALHAQPLKIDRKWMLKGKALVTDGKWIQLLDHIQTVCGPISLPFALSSSQKGLTPEEITHFAAWLLDYRAGVAVMLVTHNTHYEQLVEDFMPWLHSETELKNLTEDRPGHEPMLGYKKALENHIKQGTICRRLEIHSLSSEILTHIVQQAIDSAQRRILTPREMQSPETRYAKSWPIRVVIDDLSTLRDIFPELREDPLLLPSVLFHFEREGVTTLIVDTQSGKPDTPIAERFESELRKMVHHNLYTWRVPFFGESRVAITAIPPLSSEYAGIVRELRWESESLMAEHSASAVEPATVDPHLELYTGLEEGKPQPVPLRVLFYDETEATRAYIDLENRFLADRFVSPSYALETNSASVIVGVPPSGYDALRDFAYLQTDTRLEHTVVFQVDEFWGMRSPSRRKRAGVFQPQGPYLNGITAEAPRGATGAEGRQPDSNVDPSQLFQQRSGDLDLEAHDPYKPLRRRDFFKKYYESFSEKFEDPDHKEALIDRVPFSWDFAFLLCREKAWKTERSFTVKSEHGEVTHTVRQVWDSLHKAEQGETVNGPTQRSGEVAANHEGESRLEYVSWRVFIQACKKVAEKQSGELSKPVTAFDFAQISPESFSCLILEMWLSEIYDSLRRKASEAASKGDTEAEANWEMELSAIREAVSKRHLFTPRSAGKNKKPSLCKLVERYWLELYKCWLLLIEVINFSNIVGEDPTLSFDFKSKNTDFSSMASRHWYKTASQCPDEIAANEPLVAARLPGHFSVRGDWFLAVAGGSRSVRQAERALDLLNSRRSNIARLEMGVGLPTRVPSEKQESNSQQQKSGIGMLRTKLKSYRGGHDSVAYDSLLTIGARGDPAYQRKVGSPDDDFFWLWRSSLSDYAHCSRIWHKWLNRTLLWWNSKLLRYKSVWRNSFEVYDALTVKAPLNPADLAPNSQEIQEIEEKVRAASPAQKQKVIDYHVEKYDVRSLAQLKVRSGFLELWEVLKQELKQARDENEF